jgi:hypothetical protein
MPGWKCHLCQDDVPAADIVSGHHVRLLHPDYDEAGHRPERWPDGELVIWDEADSPDGLR